MTIPNHNGKFEKFQTYLQGAGSDREISGWLRIITDGKEDLLDADIEALIQRRIRRREKSGAIILPCR